MRDGWEEAKLSEVCEKITDGTHQTPKYFDEGFIFLSSRNVTSGKINWNNVKYIDEAQHIAMQKRVSPRVGDVLLAKNGTTGVAAIVDKDVTFDIYVSLAWLRPLENIHPEYLLHFVNSPIAKKQFNNRIKGVGVPNLHLKEIREVQIPYPPLAEQKRIVAVLDEAFEGIDLALAAATKNLKNARELFETTLNATFSQKGEGWMETTLGEVCGLQNGFAFKSNLFKTSGMPVLRISSIQNEEVSDNRPVFTNPDDYKEDLEKYIVRTGDLLIAMSGATTGKVGFNNSGNEFLLNQRVGKFEPTPNLNLDFLFYFLLTKVEENLEISAGSAQPNLSTTQIKGFILTLPPIEIQAQICKRFTHVKAQTQHLEALYQQKIDALNELKQSLLEKAFAGELTAETQSLEAAG